MCVEYTNYTFSAGNTGRRVSMFLYCRHSESHEVFFSQRLSKAIPLKSLSYSYTKIQNHVITYKEILFLLI
jgi:hypothetical protein